MVGVLEGGGEGVGEGDATSGGDGDFNVLEEALVGTETSRGVGEGPLRGVVGVNSSRAEGEVARVGDSTTLNLLEGRANGLVGLSRSWEGAS